jgi:PAS domain S-box-containing protein
MLKTVFPAPLEQIQAEVMCTGRWEGELVHTRQDGTQVVVASRWSLQRGAQGAPLGILETNNDITERKQAEQALQESEANLNRAQEIAHIGSWHLDIARNQLTWSDEVYRMFDTPGGTPLSYEAFLDRVCPEDRERVDRAWTAALQGAPYDLEHRILVGDELKWVRERAELEFDPQGKAVKGIGTVQDITERKRAEEALRRSEAYLTEAQRLSHTGSWAFDLASNKYIYLSEECLRIFEIDAQQDLPAREVVSRLIHPEDWNRVQGGFEKSLREKVDTSSEFRIVLPSGTAKHIQTIRHPVLNDAGDVVKMLGTVIDITERKRAEEERERLRRLETDLRHLNRVSMMGELAASVAHEVNQPISGVVSNGGACLRWLARDVPNVEEAREAARRIVRDGKRAGEIIRHIRALATKRAATNKEVLNLNETIQEVLALVGDEAKKKRVIIRTDFAAGIPPVSGDRVQLQQVALNLVMNAIEAMSSVDDRARELVVTTRNTDADQVLVTVEDSGTGIDPQMIDKIFDSFYTTKPGGMGMGLAISRSILQTHGGRLWAEAKDGPGTVFHFTVPKYHEEGSNAAVAGV